MRLTITKARCPVCDKFIAVADGTYFKDHKKRDGHPCPESGKPFPPIGPRR